MLIYCLLFRSDTACVTFKVQGSGRILIQDSVRHFILNYCVNGFKCGLKFSTFFQSILHTILNLIKLTPLRKLTENWPLLPGSPTTNKYIAKSSQKRCFSQSINSKITQINLIFPSIIHATWGNKIILIANRFEWHYMGVVISIKWCVNPKIRSHNR